MVDFILNNIWLVAIFVTSGLMLAWPEISRLMGASNAIGTLEATRLMNQGSTLVLDVRDGNEFAAGHLPRARHIPLSELGKRVEEINKYKEKSVLVTCQSGARSGRAVRLLKDAGFTAVYELKGGIAAWQQASLPVEK
ncbi:MAG TPA: rhodanese-like domain-containing protein [Usitatibacter sp.]|nr:rhodanese-like domain-containing protein [Usitatibacter sp.]